MKKNWTNEGLRSFWQLDSEEKRVLGKKHGAQRFLYLLILKCYSLDYSFPTRCQDIPTDLLNFGAIQYGINISQADIANFLVNNYSYLKYQKEIREFYVTILFNHANHDELRKYLYTLALETRREDELEIALKLHLKQQKVELPSPAILSILIKEILAKVENYINFGDNREYYYGCLNQPLLANEFNQILQEKLAVAVTNFDKNLPNNKYVVLTTRNDKTWIKLSPSPEQAKPQNLDKLKDSIITKWNYISLLDVLKEVDLREHFTDCFSSSGNREIIPKEEVQKRLILCLFGIGTNTGLSSISSSLTSRVSLEELKYIKRKFINQDDLREAITKVVNGIFRIRDANIWGEATTACAADSRKFTSWDQNLITEWHARYHGAGVMIYWHVTKQSICIHSQLKTCSSSEVAAMLQGVISQETDMLVESQYVDSHGKSEIGFALTYLLNFDLLPRYATVGAQKIYLPHEGFVCKNITAITTRPIDWELIATHYDAMIKYAVALKIGTATADSVIRQFSRSNYQHPTFKAFIELGRAVKSIFLCKYLDSLELRQEIHSGLNIVENWNSVNDFIFYGKKSEISSNSRDEQESSMLCLHLLQVCLAYVNTLLLQAVLHADDWNHKLTTEDLRGLTPLIYQHINPYGTFELDMHNRISLLEAA